MKLKFFLMIVTLFGLYHVARGQGDLGLYKFSPPGFSNGDEALVNYLRERINLKSRDFKYQISGIIHLKFRLTKEGEMKDFVTIDSSSSAHFNKEVFDYLKMSRSLWHTASINKQPCDVNIIVTVDLSLLDGSSISYLIQAGFVYAKDPLLYNNYYNIGANMAANSLYQDALPYFDTVLKYSTFDIDALYNRGVCYLKIGDNEKACIDWKKIQTAGKPDADKLILKYCSK